VATINRVILVGHAGSDPTERMSPAGVQVSRFSVATSSRWTDKAGTVREETEWHKVACFNKTAEFANRFVQKGALVYIEGKIKTAKWTDQHGTEKSALEIEANRIEILGSKKSDAEPVATEPVRRTVKDGFSMPPQKSYAKNPMVEVEVDDDIPY
jgi:single-strand DNA-binding protein